MSMRYDKTEHGFMVHAVFDSPSDGDWQKLLDYLLAHKDKLRGTMVFVHGDGGLTAKQRSELAEVIKVMRPGFRSAVLTNSRVTRGILTALNWLTKKQDDSSAFPLSGIGFDEAVVFLSMGAPEKQAARALAEKLGAFSKAGRAVAG
jgi:hypothetical protein